MASFSFPVFKNTITCSNLLCPNIVTRTTITLTSSSSSFPFSKIPKTNQNNKRTAQSVHMSSSSSSLTGVDTVSSSNPDHPQPNRGWLEFSNNVSGEWDGHGADFTDLGQPVELPERVVPDAYREWEVRVFDWQTQCPTLAQPDERRLFYKLIKLLPTVGCEADAATRYTVDQMNVGGDDSHVSAFAYHSSGTYVALWPSTTVNTGNESFRLEHCLVDPRNKESRVRIIQALAKRDSKLVLTNIQVFREHWYGPFRNGDQLGGCAIRDAAFAITDPLEPSQLTGSWRSNSAIARFQNPPSPDSVEQLVDDSKQCFTREDDSHVVFLPKQLWCSVKQEEDGEFLCEAGWLFEQGRAITSGCVFSTEAKLKEVKVRSESATV